MRTTGPPPESGKACVSAPADQTGTAALRRVGQGRICLGDVDAGVVCLRRDRAEYRVGSDVPIITSVATPPPVDGPFAASLTPLLHGSSRQAAARAHPSRYPKQPEQLRSVNHFVMSAFHAHHSPFDSSASAILYGR